MLNEQDHPLGVERGPNNMATSRNVISPFKFDNTNNQNSSEFIHNFNKYRGDIGWNESQARMAFKIALGGVAAVWLSTQEKHLGVDD